MTTVMRWVQDDAMFGGRPIRNREYITDTRGFIAELLAKSLKPEQLDARRSPAPITRSCWNTCVSSASSTDALRTWARARAGLVKHDYTGPEQLKKPLAVPELMRSRFMYLMSFGESDDQSAMMMEPVGGMDRVVAGFMAKVGDCVRTHSQVEAVRLRDKGVEVVYRHEGKRTPCRRTTA